MMKRSGSKHAVKQKKVSTSKSAAGSQDEIPILRSPTNNAYIPFSMQAPFQLSASKPQTQYAPKVAIPRLRRGSEDQSTSKVSAAAEKNRVAHACEPCRHRKTKCSGERPVCQHCEDFKLPCVYADGKRDRTKKQLGSLASRVEVYQELLEDLSLRAGEHDRALIRKALDREASSEDEEDDSITFGTKTSIYHEAPGEQIATARAGSTDSMDHIEEDFNRTPARATGFHGKMSEVTWMQKLKKQVFHGSDDGEEEEHGSWVDGQTSPAFQADHYSSGLPRISDSTYHCDNMSVQMPDQIDPFETPTQETADLLFQSYLETVHPSFPIIGKSTFVNQYQAFLVSKDQSKINKNWLSILNLIFAIGAKYSHLVQSAWRGDKRDHFLYFTRARVLGFNSEAILGHAELQKVQITGLITFYLMSIDQINRAWSVSGIAVRHATTLGLHLRNDSREIAETSKEIRYRVWWALCSVESILAIMTGRPTSFSETDCTAPRPLPLEEESFTGDAITRPEDITLLRRLSSQDSGPSETPSSGVFSSRVRVSPQKSLSPASQSSSQDRKQIIPPSNGLFFRYHTKLSLLNNEVLNCLYRADAMKKSWAHVQGVISTLNSKLEKWRIELPSVFDFTKRQRDQLFVRQRMSLGFFYYSTLTIINRPCLCRLDRKIPNQSTKAKNFNREIAMKCVYSACDMLQMLPDVPNTGGLYKIAPWWCLIHYLMQAATVLMLELSFRAEHMPNEVEGVFDSAKKALVWLRSMSDESEAARRAWSLCNDMLRKVAPKIGRSPNDASNIDSTSIVDNPMSYNDPAEYSGEASGQIQGMDNVPVTQHGQYAPEYSYSGGGFYQPQIFTSYDQFLSYGQVPTTSAVESFGTPFPIANDMDGITFENHDAAGYFQAQNPRWFPGSGA